MTWLSKLKPSSPDKATIDLNKEVDEIVAHFAPEAQSERRSSKTKAAEELAKGKFF